MLGAPTSPTAQRQNNFNCQNRGRTFQSVRKQLRRLWNNCCVTASNRAVKVSLSRGDFTFPSTSVCLVPSVCNIQPVSTQPGTKRPCLGPHCSTWCRGPSPKIPVPSTPPPKPWTPCFSGPSSCFLFLFLFFRLFLLSPPFKSWHHPGFREEENFSHSTISEIV